MVAADVKIRLKMDKRTPRKDFKALQVKEVIDTHERTIKEELEKIEVPPTPSEQLMRLNSVMIEAQKTLPKKRTKPRRTWHTSEETARLL